eukprot:m.263992 g.263992  ORF g.263992 m.263992 type:complete len:57 (+) comp15609_c0_seq4:1601-1771(+)
MNRRRFPTSGIGSMASADNSAADGACVCILARTSPIPVLPRDPTPSIFAQEQKSSC